MPDPTWTVSEDGWILWVKDLTQTVFPPADLPFFDRDDAYAALVECVRKAEHHDQLAAELDRIRPLIGQHDPTGADHMEDAARLAEENDRLRVERDAAYAVIRHSLLSHTPVDGCDPAYDEWEDAITRARQGHDR